MTPLAKRVKYCAIYIILLSILTTLCYGCPKGYYGTACLPCPPSTYKDFNGPADVCAPCPANSGHSLLASYSHSDCRCFTGYEGRPEFHLPCEIRSCEPLFAPPYGAIVTCNWTYLSPCVMRCDERYEPHGSIARHCIIGSSDDMIWTGLPLSCEVRSCEPLFAPPYGAIVTCNRTYLSPCVMRCDEGYEPHGSMERQCIIGSSDNMIWTGLPLSCEAIQCLALPSVKAATVYPADCLTGPVTFDRVCHYGCADGYGVNNNPVQQSIILRCKTDGTWTEQPPVCNDFSPPSLTCPFRMVVPNDPGKATAVVNWSVTQVSDNSVDVDPHAVIKVQSSHQPLDVFPIGSHIVTVTATDEAGNTADCRFVIMVIDNEPPVITSCPSDIILKDLVVSEERVNWYRPYATDNSGVPPSITSNRQSGDLFTVPGSYEIVNTAQDGSGNTATCSFRITLEKKTCPVYPPPYNGALACYVFGVDPACVVLCKEGFHFTSEPPLLYVCASGEWAFIGIGSGYTTPWPNCSAQAPPTRIESSFPYFSFSGDANDTSVIENIKDKFISLTQIFSLCPGGCQKDSVQVFAGQASS